ncbi:hypothetical protein I4U23_023056 [Adineta vaga]|nr:hypothetical protein I4U23_023056 [Adineta vaga]
MLFCGNTAFSAAHHHAPDDARFIYYCFTHIAIDPERCIGSIYRTRSGMSAKTTVCGALAVFTVEIASDKLNLHFDENDMEMKHHAKQDVEHFHNRQYALFTGIQIHGPNGTDYCWLGKASLLSNGVLYHP